MIVLALCIGAENQAFGAGEKRCSRDEATAADGEAATLRDWDSVYRSFERYAQCDDAGIGEGYSESIARLLAEDWKHFSKLDKLASRDKGFEKFVLHHVDELMTPDQEKKIYENTRLRCPATAKRLCKLIETRLDGTKPVASAVLHSVWNFERKRHTLFRSQAACAQTAALNR